MFEINMKRTKRLILLITVCLVMLIFSSCKEKTEEVKPDVIKYVKITEVKQPSSERTNSFPAISQAVREVELAFRVDGPLVRLPVETGQYVEKGELIAEIDPRDYLVRVNKVEAQLDVIKAQLSESLLQYNRYKNLYAQNAAEKAVYDRVKAAYESLDAQFKATQENLKAVQNELLDTKLLAPFSGYVDTKYVENYDNVRDQMQIVSFLDCSSIEVVTGIPEELLAEGIVFTEFSCGFDAYKNKVFDAEFKELGRKPQKANQTYPLTVILKDNDSKIIKPGMAASIAVTFKNEREKEFICVPNESLVSLDQDENYVFIYEVKSKTVKKQKVLIGKLTSSGVEIKSGLKPGQVIVTAGAGFLTNGQKVKPLPDASSRF